MDTKQVISVLFFLAAVAGLAGCGGKPAPVAPGVGSPSPTAVQPVLPITEEPKSKGEPAVAGLTDAELMDRVAKRLVTVMDSLPPYLKDPTFQIVNEDKINAYATAEIEGKGPQTKVIPKVVVFSGLMNRVIRGKEDPEGAEDRLGFVLSHELGHVMLAHIVRRPAGETAFVQQAFTRDQENQADLKGMEMALKAGFSFRKGQSAIHRMKALGLNYSSFEGIGVDHPSWNDRLTLLDKEQATLWKSMSAFQNGTFFLLFEQYAAAERCFQQVTKEFPDCHEAWTNLGYALLMQYCDGLEAADLRQFGIGQIVVGGFYTRPKSLETLVRGQDDKLWKAAVAALERAVKLKPALALPRANLGVAYLVCPQGKEVKRAQQYFEEAVSRMPAETDLPPLAKAALLSNAGVADLAAGQAKEAAEKMAQGEDIGRKAAGDLPRAPATFALFCALCYNRALVHAASGEEPRKRAAVAELEQYLKLVSPASAWWPLANEKYTQLCKELKVKPKTKSQLSSSRPAILRLVTSVKVKPDVSITLSEPLADVTARLGAGRRIPIVWGTKLARVCYPDHGVEVLAADRVLAIRLRGAKAPEVPIQGSGLSGGTQTVRPGMPQSELERILKDQPCEDRQLDQADLQYRFYPQIGLAVRLHQDKVEELVLAQIPRRPTEEE